MKTRSLGMICILLATCLFCGACSDDEGGGGKPVSQKKAPSQLEPKVLMVIAPGNFRDEELKIPKEAFEDAGFEVEIASTVTEPVTGMMGIVVSPDLLLEDVRTNEYKAVVFVGGLGMNKLFDDKQAHRVAKEAVDLERVLGAICIAPVILVRAGVVKNKAISVHESMADVCKNKGANVSAAEVTVNGYMVTGNGPEASDRFVEEILYLLE